MQKFNVTIEALKRADIEIEASDEQEARKKVQEKLMNEGAEFFEPKFDTMWDSVRIVRAVEQ